MSLTDVSVRNARPKEKPYKLRDERGLFLEVRPNGGKWWRFRFTFCGKENMLSLGTYPDTSLATARNKREEARALIAQGVNPSEARRAVKAEAEADAETFELIAREWHAKREALWHPSHAARIMKRLEQNIFPWLGNKPIRSITAPELLAALRRIEGRGALEVAHRSRQDCGQVFRYAVACGKAERDVAADCQGALTPTGPDQHRAALTDPSAVGGLLRAIDGYTGSFLTQCALKLAPLTFVRPGELRGAQWSEIDVEAAEWRIPKERMKMKEMHIVPLSRQALAILAELRPLTGAGKYVFPTERTAERHMSENTVNAALRRMGFTKEEMCSHGFRGMASTLLHEQGWTPEAIERQLAHTERNKVKAAYNHAQHLPERRRMMQAWADYLDGLKARGKVTPIRAAGGGK